MATLQKVEGVYAMEKGEAEEGSEILAAFGLLMMILGVVLYKLAERLWKVFHERRKKDEKRDQEEYQTRALARDQEECQPGALTRDHGEYISYALQRDQGVGKARALPRDQGRHQPDVSKAE